MFELNVPYPEEVFPWAIYTHNGVGFGSNGQPRNILYNPILRDAEKYIDQYRDWEIPFDSNKYNFSIFQVNDNTSFWTQHQWYVRFLSNTVNEILSLPIDTNVATLFSDRKVPNEKEALGILWTEIYPDSDFMVSINYEDFPIWFLGFNINEDGDTEIIQIQWTRIIDKTRTFYSKKHHFLSGFDWEKVLVHFFEDYLLDSNFTWKIIIQCAENNSYYNKKNIKKEIFDRRYNTTAIDLWYTRSHYNFNSRKNSLDFEKKL